MTNTILSHLPASFPWRGNIHYFNTIDSTNTEAKRQASNGAPHGTIIIAEQQCGGRGRFGRSFYSPANTGIYCSVILRPHCPAGALMHLTCATAVAAVDSIEATTGLRPGIKWTNDIVVESKKLGGILTELAVNGDGIVEYAIIGIGINCKQASSDFPDELKNIATSIYLCTGKKFSRSALLANLLLSLEQMSRTLENSQHVLAQYRKDCITIGREISLIRAEELRHGRALDIDHNGSLIVQFSDGSFEAVTSGEVSIRGMYGYV